MHRFRTYVKQHAVHLALALLPVVYFSPAIAGGVALVQGDGWVQHVGVRALVGKLLAAGSLPLWNPYVYGGMPLLAAGYPGALYPPNWVFALLPPGLAMNLVVITTFHLALVGAYLYSRSVGAGRAGALVAGVVFAFGGFLVMSLGNTSQIAGAVWLPWILLAVERTYQQASRRWCVLGAGFIALQAWAGFPQAAFLNALVVGAYVLFTLLLRRKEGPVREWGVGVAVMALGGGLLSAPLLLPLRELQAESGRAAISYEYFASHFTPLGQLPALVIPYFFGGASLPPYHVPYWGQWGVYVTCGYVGMAGLLLSLMAVGAARGDRMTYFWAAVAVISLLLACGDSLPFGLNRALYHVPVYNLFRSSFRHLFEFNLACAVLAGRGLTLLSAADERARRKAFVSGAVAGVALVAGAAVLYCLAGRAFGRGRAVPPGAASPLNAELLVPLACCALSVFALWVYFRRVGRWSAALVVAVLLADLAAYGHFLEWRIYVFSVDAQLADPETVKFIKAREGDLNSLRILSRARWPYGKNYALLNHPAASIPRGLQSVNGYDELKPLRQAAVAGAMGNEGIVNDVTALGLEHRGFDILNVKYLLSEESPDAAPPPAERWRKLAQFGEVGVYENLMALPRAWFVGEVVTASGPQILAAIRRGRLPDGRPFDPRRTALLEAEEWRESRTVKADGAEARVARYEAQRIEIITRNPQPGFLVVSEVFFPGWEAEVDARPAVIHRTDYTLRGIPVPAGEHRVKLTYRPRSFRAGLWAACAGLLLLGVYALKGRFNSGRTRK